MIIALLIMSHSYSHLNSTLYVIILIRMIMLLKRSICCLC